MKIKYKKEILFVLLVILLGQIAFALMSKNFTTPRYENRIYATTGIQHHSSDLHKLNEAAHYFGQTIIGWSKFPNFMNNLLIFADLPEGSFMNVRMQERQNIIFTIYTSEPIEINKLISVKDYLQSKLDEYNSLNQTKFILSSLDYEQSEIKKNYGYGAGIALMISLIICGAILFIRREFFI